MILGNNAVNVGIGLSNDAAQNGPQNKLEIDAGLNGTASQPNGTFGASGLRFRDLHLGNVASIANGYCLSVNPQGDVILVQDQTGGFGAPCAAPAILTQQSAVDLNGNMFHFLGNQLTSRVTIGGVCNNFVPAKLYVGQQSGTGNGTMGVFVLNTDQSVNQRVYGVYSNIAPIVSSSIDIGYVAGTFRSSGSSKRNIGVEGFANGPASTGTENYGGYFTANSGANNIGVFTQVQVGTGYALWVEGDMLFNGTLIGTNNVMTSDQMFKTNVDTLSDALQILVKLSHILSITTRQTVME